MKRFAKKIVAIAASLLTMSGSMLAVSAEESAWVSLRIQLLSGTNPEVVAEEAISIGETQSLSVTGTSFNRDDFEDLILGLDFGDGSDKSWDDVQVMDITVSSILLNDNIEMMATSQDFTVSQAAGTGFKLGSLVDINSDKWLEPTEDGSPSSSYITVESLKVTYTITDFAWKAEITTTTTESTTTESTTTTTSETTTSTSDVTTTTSSSTSESRSSTTSPSSSSTSRTTTTTTTTITKTTTQPGKITSPETGDPGVDALFVLMGMASSVMVLSYTRRKTERD